MTRLVDQLALARAGARAADKYIARGGGAPLVVHDGAKARQDAERQELETALLHIRRGLKGGFEGKAAEMHLKRIERVLERDYGVHQRIKRDRD